MGFAKIVSGGPDGRYTIELDFGTAKRTGALAQLNLATNKLQADLAAVQVQIIDAEAKLQPALAAYEAAVADFITASTTLRLTGSLPPGTPTLDTKAIDFQWNEIRRRRGANGPLYRQRDAIKFQLAVVQQETAKWNSLNVVSTRSAWCVDLTENAQAGWYVATCDIPGDSNLVLLAAGCRAWRPGDGAVSTADKAAVVANLNARILNLGVQLAMYLSKQAVALAEESALAADLNTARTAYAANPSAPHDMAVKVALKKLTAKQREIHILKTRVLSVTARKASLEYQEARWLLRPAVTLPDAGDGILTARGVMSPEQAFWNVAVFPGWQKWKPTYRWGTATSIDYANNTMNVALSDQTSNAQGLPINQTSTLNAVPVVYMTCNAEAFEVGDRVVVQFLNQNWKTPRVIGFLDNPKPCAPWPPVGVVVEFETTVAPPTGLTRPFIGRLVGHPCGDTPAYIGNIEVCTTATHRVVLKSVGIQGSPPGFSLTSSKNAGDVLWTGPATTAYRFNGQPSLNPPTRVPAGDFGVWYTLESSARISEHTMTSHVHTLFFYSIDDDLNCKIIASHTGGEILSTSTTVYQPEAHISDWLADQMPTISVTRGSVTAEYVIGLESVSGPTGDPDNRRFVISYVKP